MGHLTAIGWFTLQPKPINTIKEMRHLAKETELEISSRNSKKPSEHSTP